MEKAVFPAVSVGRFWLCFAATARAAIDRLYHPPILVSTAIPSSAASENHATLDWPRGTTMNAARSGPSDDPVFPPTWNNDCANPCCPPEAIRATREDSGWNTADP